MGNYIDGFQNELNLIEYINSKDSFDLYNENIKGFLSFIFEFDLSGRVVRCFKEGGQQKPDFSIRCKNVTKYISVKKGSGNSVHQESFNEFIGFLTSISTSTNTIDSIKLYHYGDGTLDDTGVNRYSASQCSSMYTNQIQTANNELNQREKLTAILNRVLFLGNVGCGNLVDYIYYGSVDSGIWASRNELLNYFLNNTFQSTTIHFASLTYQVWGRNNNFTAKHPDRRYIMQVKWSQIVFDINTIRECDR